MKKLNEQRQEIFDNRKKRENKRSLVIDRTFSVDKAD